jgi:hypothetical protein
MHARVVRFTNVDPDHRAARLADVEASEGPPVDIPAKGVQGETKSGLIPGAPTQRCPSG